MCPTGDDRAASVAVPRLVEVRGSGLGNCGRGVWGLGLVWFGFRASGLVQETLRFRAQGWDLGL